MTELLKPIRRRCTAPFKHYKKRIVITLLPGDRVRMHLERDRIGYIADASLLFEVMADWFAQSERRRKAAERKERRLG
jgi:hypothetical protein